jgi:methylenetetrahydrofolate dehydrogenase (NADP+)/methenyltetrahydrofolate cyclohydrolase
MTSIILDGAATARALLAETAQRVRALKAHGMSPALAVVVAGDDAASQIYVRNKVRACSEAGVRSERIAIAAEAHPAELLAVIARLNHDPRVHGVLVQLPLPPQHDVRAVMDAITPDKDVDGFAAGSPFLPCTPAGIVELLERNAIEVAGRDVVIVGRSAIVGKPLAHMLIDRGATVTVCHSQTRQLAAHTRRADIVVLAAGRPGLLTAPMVREGVIVVDVGINRLADGRVVGDADFEGVMRLAARITPVPGGVGPMTVAMVVANAVTAAERAATPAETISVA